MQQKRQHHRGFQFSRIILLSSFGVLIIYNNIEPVGFIGLIGFCLIVLCLHILVGKIFYLNKKQIQNLKSNSEFYLKIKKTEFNIYAPAILGLCWIVLLAYPTEANGSSFKDLFIVIISYGATMFYIPFVDEKFLFNQLFFTKNQIVYLGLDHAVIDQIDVQEISITDGKLSINELHGNLGVPLSTIEESELEALKNHLNEFKQQD